MEENVLTTEELLNQLEAYKQSEKNLAEEKEFRELYPDVEIEDLPDEVSGHTDEGLPLAAAYALYERKQFMANKKADKVNLENAQKSPGNIKHDGTNDGTFTFEQIKKMSADEVRRNYDSIIASLEKKSK
ncbi:MAG: hypothetical protein FWF15_10535 [Oscillospiraceae bacterium]|nr:hypothetical protein [Oscillospiraceae bacterium]